MYNREKTEEFILGIVKKVHLPTYNLIKETFEEMNDTQFKSLMSDIKAGRDKISFVVDHDDKLPTIKKMISILNSLGCNPIQKITTHSLEFGEYTSPIPTTLMILPCRRPIQSLDKKISIATGDKKDPLTGAVTGESKSSKLTIPEIQVLGGYGSQAMIKEFLNDRGGDLGAGRAFDSLLYQNGKVSFKETDIYATGATSTKTLKAYWTASHIKSSL